MQTVCVGPHAPIAKMCMLPIIDLKPSDDLCIYFTLLYVIEQTSRLNKQAVACVTFDQTLYIKAVDIATAANLNVVCHLGGFHTLMNFLDAIGYVMKGSGIEELLSLLYGPSTVDHVMSGKAFARALRGHFIVHDCLLQLLLQYVVGDESQRNNSVVLQVDGNCPLDVEDVDNTIMSYTLASQLGVETGGDHFVHVATDLPKEWTEMHVSLQMSQHFSWTSQQFRLF